MSETNTASQDDAAHTFDVEAPAPPREDDESTYGEKVRKRIAKERRARGEAERALEALVQRNRALEERLRESDRVAVDYADAATTQRVAALQDALRAAYVSGDANGVVQIQTELSKAANDATQIDNIKRRQTAPAPANSTPQGASFTPETQAWISRNPWFNSDGNMRDAAIRIHNSVSQNHQPDTPEYFAELDRRIRGAFPDYFEDEEEAEPPQVSRTGGAPASQARTVGGAQPVTTTRIKLTAEMMDMARAMGMTPEKYAANRARLIREGKIRA